MKLPHRKNSYIPKGKLINYLLSETHPVGRSKAKLFRGIGFNETNVNKLSEILLDIAQTQDIKETRKLDYGTNYAIDGTLQVGKKKITIRTVWFITSADNKPRFVTAYPV